MFVFFGEDHHLTLPLFCFQRFFADLPTYGSMIDGKEKLLQTMKKSNENLVPLDFSPVEEQCRQLSETFRVDISFLRLCSSNFVSLSLCVF